MLLLQQDIRKHILDFVLFSHWPVDILIRCLTLGWISRCLSLAHSCPRGRLPMPAQSRKRRAGISSRVWPRLWMWTSSLINRLLLRPLLPSSRTLTMSICLFPGCATTRRLSRLNTREMGPARDPVSKPLWLFNHRSGVLRAAVAALPGSERSVLALWEGQQVPLRPACGAAVHQLGPESACQSVPTNCTLCLRKACAAVFSLDASR